MDPLAPPLAVIAKVGSIVAHVEEYLSLGGSPMDRAAIESLLLDPEVVAWMGALRGMSLVPERRV